MTGVRGNERKRAGMMANGVWIPAYAGMTERAGMTDVKPSYVRGGTEACLYTLSKEVLIGMPEPGKTIPTINCGVLGGNFHTIREYQPLSYMVGAFRTLEEINHVIVERAPMKD